MSEQHDSEAGNRGPWNASVDFHKVTALAVTGIFLLLSAGMTETRAAAIDGSGGSGFVQDWVDEESGVAGGHYASHDHLIHPGIDGSHTNFDGTNSIPGTELAHWSWVGTSPTDAPAVTAVKYFLHNGVGLHGAASPMTAPQVADIAAAAGVWNASGANVALVPVLSDAAADVHVHRDTTSGCGAGPIGCSEFAYFTSHNPAGYGAGSGHPVPGDPGPHPQHKMAGNTVIPLLQKLTIYDGFTWYSGAAGGIPNGSLDFLTVAIQEFGHHLGLGHNSAANGHAADVALSPVNGILPSGNALRRTLQPTDVAAITHLYGAIPEPSSIMLAVLALLGLLASGSRKRCAS